MNGKEAFVSAEFTKSTYYVTAGVLNIRAGANTDSEILGKLNKDDVIETTNQVQNEWLQFDYNGKVGYVHVPYLTGKAPVIEKKEVVAQEEAPARTNTPVKNNTVVKNKESVKSNDSIKNVESSKPVVKKTGCKTGCKIY